jgi:ABC-type dipeptide/oligopeptide/nickel transport system permease subunit
MLVLGLLGWFLYFRVARSAIEIIRQQALEEAEAAAKASQIDMDA